MQGYPRDAPTARLGEDVVLDRSACATTGLRDDAHVAAHRPCTAAAVDGRGRSGFLDPRPGSILDGTRWRPTVEDDRVSSIGYFGWNTVEPPAEC